MSLSHCRDMLPHHRHELGEEERGACHCCQEEEDGEDTSSIIFVVVVIMSLSSHEVGQGAVIVITCEGGRERSGSPGESGRGRGRQQGRVVVIAVSLSLLCHQGVSPCHHCEVQEDKGERGGCVVVRMRKRVKVHCPLLLLLSLLLSHVKEGEEGEDEAWARRCHHCRVVIVACKGGRVRP